MTTIDNNTLVGLTANETLVKEFPFLATLRLNSRSTGCCGRANSRFGNPNAIKTQLAHLPLQAQLRFKQLTGWTKVRVVYETGSSTKTVIF